MTPHWTSALPPHWKVEKLKYLAEVRLSNADKKSVDGEQSIRLCNYVDVYKNDFITSTMPFMEATATDSQIRELALRAGDVLITKDSEEWNDIAVPAFVPVDLPGVICGYHLAHIRADPTKVFGGYLSRAFTAQGIAEQFKLAANGITRYGISKDDIAAALFPVPPLEEQHLIAEFLDRKTVEIDAIVAKKERLIELLREERQSLISRAVTRGLDDSAPLKETGIRWLGKVPEHWRQIKLKQLFRFVKRQGYPNLTVLSVYREYGVIEKAGRDDNHNRTPENLTVYQLVNPGDLVVNKMKAWQGSLGISTFTGITSPDYAVFVPTHQDNPDYLHYVLRNRQMADVYRSISNGIRPDQWRIEPEELLQLPLFLPPPEEQSSICEHVRGSLIRIDTISNILERFICKLREYRHALLSAAVTGKITVTQQPAVVVPVEPAKKPNPYFRRTVFAAEIINQLHDDSTFGHVKFQKVFFVAQHHLRLGDFEENYHRMQAGPHDNQMIRSVDSQLSKQKWFAANQTGERYVYEKLEKAGQHKKYFDGWFKTNAPALSELLALFRPMTTAQAEIVATLYAAWNDFLLLGEPFDDDRIIDDVLNNWHESKQKIAREKWKAALDWMRTKNLVPSGFGKPTRTANANSSTSTTAEEETAAGNESM
jgi:type I restriction enzyme S subunit